MKCQYGEKIDINSLGLVSPFLRDLYWLLYKARVKNCYVYKILTILKVLRHFDVKNCPQGQE